MSERNKYAKTVLAVRMARQRKECRNREAATLKFKQNGRRAQIGGRSLIVN